MPSTTSISLEDPTFLLYFPGENATLSVLECNGNITTFNKLNLTYIQSAAPILALAFEETRKGPRHSIEDTSLTAVTCLLRHIYTMDHYVPQRCWEDQSSLLVHVQIYRLADIYNMTNLKDMAKGRIFVELEQSVSDAQPAEDLCEALSFTYKYLPNEKKLTETLVHYVITCFITQRINQDVLFKTFHYECRQFQQDLSTVLMENRYEDETAPTLMQLPIKPPPLRFLPVYDNDPWGAVDGMDEDLEALLQRRVRISRLETLKLHFRVRK